MKLHPLHPFPGQNETLAHRYKVFAGAMISNSQIELRFRIEATHANAFSDIVLPEVNPAPERADDLWKTTCFECFIPGKDQAYLEFNGSPSGDWNLYSFPKYREGMKPAPVPAQPSVTNLTVSEKELKMTWTLPLPADVNGPFGLAVVLHTTEATLYWALKHESDKPDFHARASFTYDPIRN